MQQTINPDKQTVESCLKNNHIIMIFTKENMYLYYKRTSKALINSKIWLN